ncbi:hypothetical protein AB0K09_23030 [Streptomyces sp. NPDC049577]|uniref:hypothetical protein n=1 Tax=Streptomyces sp. NPDC049577 TaxID=3155153 RepID=UPI003435702C
MIPRRRTFTACLACAAGAWLGAATPAAADAGLLPVIGQTASDTANTLGSAPAAPRLNRVASAAAGAVTHLTGSVGP